jgi:hypothetical protein
MNRPAAHLLALGCALCAGSAAAAPVFHSFEAMAGAVVTALPPVRAVTRGPAFHGFGYYDKFQLDAAGRRLLCMEVSFEHRLPGPDEEVRVGMVDLADGDRWTALGASRAWSWQQGCMLQWRPGSDREVVWNDREGDRFVARVLDVETRSVRTLPRAVEHISPDGRYAACSDFRRIAGIRPGYGYAGPADPHAGEPAPAAIGVWRMDMDTGETVMLASVAEVAAAHGGSPEPGQKHYINHLAWSPDGRRLLMFHRWTGEAGQPTRVFTIGADGRDLRLLAARHASHWTWRDPGHVVIWADGAYRLYEDDGSGVPKRTLWEAPNGHHSFVPGTGNAWLVTDTYPRGKAGEQIVYLVNPERSLFVLLGRFRSSYGGEWRCDTHPRLSRDGRLVIIDSPHGGDGRQQYVIDIGRIRSEVLSGGGA